MFSVIPFFDFFAHNFFFFCLSENYLIYCSITKFNYENLKKMFIKNNNFNIYSKLYYLCKLFHLLNINIMKSKI